MKKRNWSFYILLIVLTGPLLFFLFLKLSKVRDIPLPIYGERQLGPDNDTIYHTIPPFAFTDQYGNTVTDKDFDSGIYIANFFFATCPTICPAMNTELSKIADKLREHPHVKFISHTVDPDNDSVAVLAEYAKAYKAEKGKWYIVTGSKKSIYEIAQTGYLVSAGEGDVKPASFIHSQHLVLVDSKKRIRGMYDALNYKEVNRLKDDIVTLLKQEHGPKPGTK